MARVGAGHEQSIVTTSRTKGYCKEHTLADWDPDSDSSTDCEEAETQAGSRWQVAGDDTG